MRLCSLLVTTAFFIGFPLSAFAQDNPDFRLLRWSMLKAQVLEIEKNTPGFTDRSFSLASMSGLSEKDFIQHAVRFLAGIDHVSYEESLNDQKVKLEYEFWDGKLVSASYLFNSPASEENVTSIKSKLEEKYGKPFKRRDNPEGVTQYLNNRTIIRLTATDQDFSLKYFSKEPQRYDSEKKSRISTARQKFEQLTPGTFFCNDEGCLETDQLKKLDEKDKL